MLLDSNRKLQVLSLVSEQGQDKGGLQVLVYETEEFKREARQYGVYEHAARTTNKIESASTRLEVVDCVGKYYQGLLVDRQGNFRLIGDIHRMDDGTDVFIWLRVLIRGGADYVSFWRVADRIKSSVDRVPLEEWFSEEKRIHDARSQTPQLPDKLRPWLEAPRQVASSSEGGYIRVFESAEWVRAILETHQGFWGDIYSAVCRIVERLQSHGEPDIGALRHETAYEGNLIVEYYYPDALSVFLVSLASSADASEPDSEPPKGRAASARLARRAYDDWILLSRDLWFEIQDQKESNLSLSPEERGLLDAVAGYGVSEHRLPLFINGQAGSGKSTMLAYIFAGLLSHAYINQLDGRPLFITYNEELLKRASQTTAQLIRHDTRFLNDAEAVPSGSFVTWRDFLVSLIGDEKTAYFLPAKRVDFHDFKLSWERRGGRLPRYDGPVTLSAELVWFVIKALIKGSDSLEDLTAEEYSSLSVREQPVTVEDFQDIYENVYRKWYKSALQESELWDDQDLVSEVLQSLRTNANQLRPSIENGLAALVVDEAQDFTRRELRVLTRLLIYANYEIPNYGVPLRMPMVLAGDPLQTLSPTGFDWSRIRAAIYEEFGLLFGPAAEVPEIEVLNFNYRSAEPIVKIGNSVQLWRDALFDLDGIRAQTAWNPATVLRNPEKFLFSQIRDDDFIRFARDSVIIVPCDEGGEEDFIENDPVLSRMFQSDSDLTAEGFVFSPVAIKGLEFERVVLYKFGESCPEVDWLHDNFGQEERRLQAEYFFNKLYVAVTRATEFLFIVDSDSGDQKLWKYFTAEAVLQLAGRVPHNRREDFLQGVLVAGESVEISPQGDLSMHLGHVELGVELRDVQEQNPKAVADGIRRYGLETRNPTKMRQAAGYYRRSADNVLATECEAHALRFEDRLIEAAKLFDRSQRFDLSWECRWEHADWIGLAEIAERVPSAPSQQRLAVQIMSTPNLSPRDLMVVHDGLKNEQHLPRNLEKQWSEVFERLVSVQTSDMEDLSEEELREISSTLERLFEFGHRQVGPLLARVLLGVGDPEHALRVAERSPAGLDPALAAEIADCIGFPDGLKTLLKAKLFADVVQAWEQHECPGGSQWLEAVVPALQALGRHSEVIELYLGQESPHLAADLVLELCLSGKQRNDAFIVEVAERVAATGAVVQSFDFLDQLYEVSHLKNVLPNVIISRSKVVVAWAESQEERGWPPLDRRTVDLLKNAAEDMAEACRENVVRRDDVPAVISLAEQVLGRRVAMGLCGNYARSDERPSDLRTYTRERFIVLAGEEIDHLSATQVQGDSKRARELADIRKIRQDRAREWGYASFKDVPNQRRSRLGKKRTELNPTGECHNVLWDYDSANHRVELKSKDETWFVRYLLSDQRLDLKFGVEVESTSDGIVIPIGDGGRVLLGAADPISLSFAHGDEISDHFVLHQSTRRTRRSVQPASSRSRSSAARKAGPIKAHKLARELDVPLRKLITTATGMGMRRRNGNASFDAAEAGQLRQAFSEKR